MDELHRETGFWTLCDKSVDLFGLRATIQDTIIHSIRHYDDSSRLYYILYGYPETFHTSTTSWESTER